MRATRDDEQALEPVRAPMLAAHTRATLLLYGAVQFVVLSAIAMQLYSGGTITDPWSVGYDFWRNFLSDLGATRAWSGRPNHAAMVLFSLSLASIGIAFVAFSSAWRAFAFARRRARAAGIAAQTFGTLGGCAFVGVAAAPVNVALDVHNTLVVAAFALLLGYALSITILWARNDATRVQLVISAGYLGLVLVYVAVVVHAARQGIGTERGRSLLVVSQKLMVYGSMAYVIYLALAIRRQLAGPRNRGASREAT